MQAKRIRKCAICRQPFEKKRAFQKIPDDHIDCLVTYGRAESAKKERKEAAKRKREQAQEKREHKAKLEQSKGIRWHLDRAQKAFNKFIKARDFGMPCVCCGEPMDWYQNKDIDAGHLRTVAAAGHLRFHEDNCHAQRVYCNRNKAGNQADYRANVVQRIGQDRVDALFNDNRIKNWTREELTEIWQIYTLKTKELHKQRSCAA